jgi:hypothetical protein
VGAAASFKHDNSGWLSLHKLNKLAARRFLAKLQLSCHQGTVKHDDILCQVKTNHFSSAVLSTLWPILTTSLAYCDAVWESGTHPVCANVSD